MHSFCWLIFWDQFVGNQWLINGLLTLLDTAKIIESDSSPTSPGFWGPGNQLLQMQRTKFHPPSFPTPHSPGRGQNKIGLSQTKMVDFVLDGISRDPLKPSYINVVIPSNGDTCDLPNMKYQLFIDHLERPRNLPAWLQTTTRVSIRDEFRVRLWAVFPRKVYIQSINL